MLMLQRAAENVNPSECNDPAVLLACSLGSDSCPAACQKKAEDENLDTEKKDTNRVIAGDLDVSVVDYSSSIQSAPKGIFVANTLKFNASEKIQLDSLTLKRTGLGTSKAIKKVWLEKNGVAVTNSASVGSDGLAVLNFKSNRDTISEATEYQLVIQLDETYESQGDEFAFSLQSAESTAKNTTISGTTSTYRVSNYEVVKLTANISNPNTYNAEAKAITPIEYKLGSSTDYIIWEFTLQSDSKKDDRDIYVKSLTFKNKGTADFGDTFKNVKVYRDSKVVSNNVEVNGKDVTISLDKDTIKANRKAVYTIRAEVATLERAWDTVQLYFKDAKDIIADEYDTNFRANIVFDDEYAGESAKGFADWELSLYQFNGGKVTFENDSNFAKTVNAGISSTDVVIAKGKLVVTEPVELPAIEIKYDTDWTTTAGPDDVNFTVATDTIRRLVLKIGDKRYTADPDTTDGHVWSFSFKDVTVRETSDVELLISIWSKEGKLNNQTITFKTNLGKALMGDNVGSFQNNDSQLKVSDIAGNIQIAKVQIKKPKFSITASSLETQETVINTPDSKILMKGKLEAKENDVNVNNLKVTFNWDNTLVEWDTIEVTLSLGDSTFWTSRSLEKWASYVFNSLGTIKAGESVAYELSVSPTIAHKGNLWLTVKASGTDSNWNSTETSEETSATLEVKGAASVDLSSTSTSNRVVKPTNGVVIYEGSLNVQSSNAELQSFKLTATAPAKGLTITSPKLYIDGESVDVDGKYGEGVFTFNNMTENLQAGKHTVQIKANVAATTKANANDEDTYTYNLKVTGAEYVYDNIKPAKTSNETSNTYFAKWWFKLSKQSSSSDKVLNVKLTNTSEKTIRITGVTVSDADADVTVKNIAKANLWTAANQSTVSVWAGESIDIQIIASAGQTARLNAVAYEVDDNWTYSYSIDSTNDAVGSWKDFYSIAKE